MQAGVDFFKVNCFVADLLAMDAAFRSKWESYSQEIRSWNLFALREVEAGHKRLAFRRGKLHRRHRVHFEWLKSHFSEVEEQDFRMAPEPREWIRFARDDQRKAETLKRWELRLRQFVESAGAPGFWVADCNLKPQPSVESKIRAYLDGTADLDLWDVVRSRICALGPGELLACIRSLQNEFEGRILRVRNYFVRPRRTPENSLYTAIHFELRDEYDTFMEIQFMTARRNAICLIDHSLVRKSMVAFRSWQEEIWLQEMSLTANILDAEQLERELSRTPASVA